MSKINFYQYHSMTEKLFIGVALTNENMNSATAQIAKYLSNGGAQNIVDALGLCIIERERGGKVWYRRIVHRLDMRELTVQELCNIGLFLPYGAFYGKCGVPKLTE